MAEEKFHDSILDSFLDLRPPAYKDLGLKDAQTSGEEVLHRTHQFEEGDLLGEISKSVKKNATFAVQDNWHTAASEDSKAESDTESLMNEVTMSLEQAGKEGKIEKKEISDVAVQKYIKKLLNMGTSPAKVAAELEKLAEVEQFNHQMSTDYLQRNAGMIGMAFLEPNTFMDKANPNYRHTSADRDDGHETDISEEGYCTECGKEHPSIKVQNGEQLCSDCRQKKKVSSSNDCVRQLNSWKQAGITPRAKSVKQISACEDCTFFKKDASGKRCNLYKLPIVANAHELSQIVNNLTPGVPLKQKHAALVQIANRTDEHVQMFDAGKTAQTSLVKTADARVDNQARRIQKPQKTLTAVHVAKLHDKNVGLSEIYKWATSKFGAIETSVAFRGFVQSFRKNEKGRIVVAAADLKFLNSIGIRSELFEGGAKCASCPSHNGRAVRPVEDDRGAMRVGGKFAERTLDAVRIQKTATSVQFTAGVIEVLHGAGHNLEKIFKGGARKAGLVQATQAINDFVKIAKQKKIALSQIDCKFLKSKIGTHNPIFGEMLPGSPKVNIKTASNVKDGHAVLNEYDLSAPVRGIEIDMDEPDRLEIETNGTYRVDLE